MKATLNIVGGGRLGATLGALAQASGRYRVGAVLCRERAHAEAAVSLVGDGVPLCDLAALPPAGLTLIAVPDAAIAPVAAKLAAAGVLAPGSVAFHASGAGEASLLAPLAAQGVCCASLHPAFSFADPARARLSFAGTLCAFEGDTAAQAPLYDFAHAIGGAPFALAPGGKAAYHAALSVASNYLVTLAALAARIAAAGGVDTDTAARLIGTLMQQTLSNVRAIGPAAALTGPIARGDDGTVARHLAVLAGDDAAAYRALGRLTLALASAPDAAQRERLAALLAD
ncbi:Rossmann-like and DUF2520 domain-containing protein [Crenobacter intestini]|uniref:DUF2520 domain-containing protein n=1 Tax=Crenobacter intestini TaxID=2563443 RepID=A0A4T0UJJ5_9NEIS|nr:Rossmann-like and DUF2520 domain-containing protein [Crenobacter intestini]TIC78749.1 DUF2520 domain-containing protein [Crenobacter intestini]